MAGLGGDTGTGLTSAVTTSVEGTTQVFGQVCGDVVSLAIDTYVALKNAELFDEELRAAASQVADIISNAERMFSLDSDFFDEALFESVSAGIEAIGTDIASAYGGEYFESLKAGVLDPANGAKDLVADFFSTSTAEELRDAIPEEQLSAPDTVYKPSMVRGRFSEPAKEVECGDDLVSGALAGVGSAVKGVLNRASSVAQSAAGVIGLILTAIPKLLYGAAHVSASDMLDLFDDRDNLLDKISAGAEDIASTIEGLTEEHYFPNLFQRSGKTIAELRRASRALDNVERFMLSNNVFDSASYDRAIGHVDEARKEICEFNLLPDPAAYGAMFQLQMHLTLFGMLQNTIEKKNDVMLGIQSLLIDFRGDLESNVRADSLLVGIINQVKCRIDNLMGRLQAAQRTNQLAFYMAQQAAACVELNVLLPFMKLIEKSLSSQIADLNSNNPLSESVGQIEAAAQALNIDTPDYRRLLASMDFLVKESRVSLSRFQDASRIRNIADSVKANAEALKGQGVAFEQGVAVALTALIGVRALLDQVSGGIGGEEFGEAGNATVESLRSGDWETLFSLDAASQSLKGLAAKLLAGATACCSSSGRVDTSQGALTDLLDITKVLSQEARSESLFRDAVTSYGKRDAKAALSIRIPKIKQDIAKAKNAAKADCLQ